MGAGPFAAPMFESLLTTDHEVIALVTRPARNVRTRGKAPVNPNQQIAEAASLPVEAPENINSPEAQEMLTNLNADLFVVCDYGQILKKKTLGCAALGGINLHGSLLPRHRGASPVQAAILHGDQETGVTVIHMTPKLDGGPTLAVARTEILAGETSEQLEPRLAELGVTPVHEAIALLESWDGESPIGQVQDPSLATRAPRIAKQEGEVDWSQSAVRICNQVRAFKPWPKTFTHYLPGEAPPLRLILDEVAAVDSTGDTPPGQVSHASPDTLHIATGDGALSLLSVQPAGKRCMPIAEFLRGRPIKEGERFGPATPPG